MFDTIHFQLDTTNYPLLQEKLINGTFKKDSTKYYKIDDNVIETAYIHYHDTDKIYTTSITGSLYNPSYSYFPIFIYRKEDKILNINTSIPKYIFGTNIYQFFNPNDIPLPHYSQAQYYTNLLNDFIKSFLHPLTEQPIKAKHITINRIDICFNMLFIDQHNLDLYFAQLQQKCKAIFQSKNLSFYKNEGIQYKVHSHSFKIYKKYQEFMKHDLKALRLAKTEHNLDFLMNESKKILRFEISVRKKYYNQILQSSKYLKSDINFDKNITPKSKELFTFVYKSLQKFNEYMQLVKIENLTSIDGLKKHIEHNKKYLGKTDRIKTIIPFILLHNIYTKDELLKMGIYSTRVYQLNMKYLKDNNITIKSSLDSLIIPENDNFNAYNAIFYYHHNYFWSKFCN